MRKHFAGSIPIRAIDTLLQYFLTYCDSPCVGLITSSAYADGQRCCTLTNIVLCFLEVKPCLLCKTKSEKNQQFLILELLKLKYVSMVKVVYEGYCFSGRRPSDVEQLRVIKVKHVHVLLVSYIYIHTQNCLYYALNFFSFKWKICMSPFMNGDVFARMVHSGCLS